MFHENRPMSFCSLSYNFHVIKLTLCYHLMVSTTLYRQPHSNRFGFMGYFFSWGCNDSCAQTKDGLYYDWFPMDVFLPYNYNIFHIFTLTSGHIFSLMCQHNMKNERHWKLSFFTFMQKLCVGHYNMRKWSLF
jgi:hypothetical protein